MVPLVGGPTAVSRVEAELWREANAEGGGVLSTSVTTDDGEVIYADRIKLMAWCGCLRAGRLQVTEGGCAHTQLHRLAGSLTCSKEAGALNTSGITGLIRSLRRTHS